MYNRGLRKKAKVTMLKIMFYGDTKPLGSGGSRQKSVIVFVKAASAVKDLLPNHVRQQRKH